MEIAYAHVRPSVRLYPPAPAARTWRESLAQAKFRTARVASAVRFKDFHGDLRLGETRGRADRLERKLQGIYLYTRQGADLQLQAQNR